MKEASDQEFSFRFLEYADFDKGFPQVYKGLTEVGESAKGDQIRRFDAIFPRMEDTYKIVVIEDTRKERIVGAGSVFIERKFLRNLGLAGHIEDIVVDQTLRGKNLGRRLIELLKQLAAVNGCYKIILDCAEHNVAFYKKCGFSVKGVEMSLYMAQQPKL